MRRSNKLTRKLKLSQSAAMYARLLSIVLFIGEIVLVLFHKRKALQFRKPHKSSQVPGRRGQGVRRRVPRLDGEDKRGRATGSVRQR